MLHYLKAVEALKNAADGRAVVAKMKEMPTEFFKDSPPLRLSDMLAAGVSAGDSVPGSLPSQG